MMNLKNFTQKMNMMKYLKFHTYLPILVDFFGTYNLSRRLKDMYFNKVINTLEAGKPVYMYHGDCIPVMFIKRNNLVYAFRIKDNEYKNLW